MAQPSRRREFSLGLANPAAMRQVDAPTSRRLLLQGQGLCARHTHLTAWLEQLGFIQLDSINAVARAHELTLWARWPEYRHESLFSLLPAGQAFEHFTHDASLLPSSIWPYWGARFWQRQAAIEASKWWRERLVEDDLLEQVTTRLQQEGPLQSRHFSSGPKGQGGWWNWKPHKSALEYLWHSGQITVVARHNFQKVYDLSERHLGRPLAPPPDYVDWACRGALERLGVATSGELAAYWKLVTPSQAKDWMQRQTDFEAVLDCAGRPALARTDWDRPIEIPKGLRLLSPFDPILRDRQRAARLFDFDFRFEAFVPAAQRQFGYYSLPILDGEQLVGPISPQVDRKKSRLVVPSAHWKTPPSPARQRRLQSCLERLAQFLGLNQLDG